jgi:hypothetical protein
MGAFMRFVLKRAAPAPREEGTVMAPAPVGKKASGGWRDAKGLPSASTISRIAGMALLAGAALLIGTRASAKARRR